jgi:pyruvate dehydrogenase E1 component alpha subunit
MGNKLSKDELLGMLYKMLQVRFFEEKVFDLLARNIVTGASHVYAGQEAVAVGACSAIRDSDYITSTHRGHGHCIAKGGKLPEMLAELCGKATGYCKGRGGSMHIADVSKGNLGATGIVGSNIPVATGAGLSVKMRKTDQVVLCFFGDGATNQGCFHESLNMAATWKLPVIYVCENNKYGMSVALERCFPIDKISVRAMSYNMPGVTIDGMDVLTVRGTMLEHVERARRGGGPSLVECETYRFYGHSRSDPRVYRTREEEQQWKERCPIKLYKEKLQSMGMLTEDQYKAMENKVQQEVKEAEEFALSSPYPKPEELCDDVYAP